MPPSTNNFGQRLGALVSQIYPDLDRDILSSKIVDAFWPEGTRPRKRGRVPSNNLWTEHDALLITYGNSIVDGVHKPLDLLHDFLLRRMKGVVNGVHILPFFPFTSDDGFAVSDFRVVNPQLGDWPDINRIADEFHLMSDLVLNHVSSQGAWFNAYRQGQAPYDRFFFEASPDDDLDNVVRPRTTPLLQKIETTHGVRHVWCTFSHDQIDLDFRNPEVLLEFLRIIRLQEADVGSLVERHLDPASIRRANADEPGRLVVGSVRKPVRDTDFLAAQLVDDLQVDALVLVQGLVPQASETARDDELLRQGLQW